MSASVLAARGRLGYASKTRSPRAIEIASRDLAAAKIEQYVERVVSESPPLTPEQRDRIAGLLSRSAS